MTDVFISYKREERDQARRLEQALDEAGLDVWRDDEILPGDQYRAVTMQILKSCRAAIVIWSPLSAVSSWVLDEAETAKARGVLIPVHFTPMTEFPLGFGQTQSHTLVEWDGKPEHPQFQPVLAAVRRLVGAHGSKPHPQRAPAAVEGEVAFWRGVQESHDPADFEAYLARYSDGLFADLARRRVEALSQSARPRRAPRKRPQTLSDVGETPPVVSPTPSPPSPKSQHAPMPSFTASPMPFFNQTYTAAPDTPRRDVAPFTRMQAIIVAATALIAPFPLWPLVNVALGYNSPYYVQDMANLFDPGRFDTVFYLSPILFGLAFLYDRVDVRLTKSLTRKIVRYGLSGVLAVTLLLSLGWRENGGLEAHAVLWTIAVWIAALTSRRVAPWLRARLSGQEETAPNAPPAP